MKKYYFLGALALTLVFTSCSIEKRHYMNGYHVTWNHKAKHADQHNTTTAVMETPAAATVETIAAEQPEAPATIAVEESTVSAVAPASVITEENTAVQQSTTNNSVVASPSAVENTKQVSKKSSFIQKRLNNTSAPAPETDKVLLVILAILLPPLAMYLYEGSWTSRCTLNLILTLLCGIPGMIHALVVILGGK